YSPHLQRGDQLLCVGWRTPTLWQLLLLQTIQHRLSLQPVAFQMSDDRKFAACSFHHLLITLLFVTDSSRVKKFTISCSGMPNTSRIFPNSSTVIFAFPVSFL